MRSCKEVARILASGEEVKGLVRMELAMHFAICSSCRGYKAALKRIDQAAKILFGVLSEKELRRIHEIEAEVIERNTN